MPNTPALLGAGVTGLYATPSVDAQQHARAEQVLASAGRTRACLCVPAGRSDGSGRHRAGPAGRCRACAGGTDPAGGIAHAG
ncbi:hypothetical protein G6F40_017982 [Rhizopus arrhizus]|nr:hypothetical protein G6F40_017982 [Rhizopus arrhizus]